MVCFDFLLDQHTMFFSKRKKERKEILVLRKVSLETASAFVRRCGLGVWVGRNNRSLYLSDERRARHESLSIPADGDLRQRRRVTSHGRWHAAEAPVRLCRVGNEMRWARIRRGISIMPTASQPVLLLLVCMHAYALAAVASCSAGPSCSCRSIDGLNLNLTCLPLGLVGH